MQDRGDASGADEVGGGNPLDESVDVFAIELAFGEGVLQGLALRFAEVTLVVAASEAFFQFVVDGFLYGVSHCRGPDAGQVAGAGRVFLGLPDGLGCGQLGRVVVDDLGEDDFGVGEFRFMAGDRLAGGDVGGVGLPSSGHPDVQRAAVE